MISGPRSRWGWGGVGEGPPREGAALDQGTGSTGPSGLTPAPSPCAGPRWERLRDWTLCPSAGSRSTSSSCPRASGAARRLGSEQVARAHYRSPPGHTRAPSSCRVVKVTEKGGPLKKQNENPSKPLGWGRGAHPQSSSRSGLEGAQPTPVPSIRQPGATAAET